MFKFQNIRNEKEMKEKRTDAVFIIPSAALCVYRFFFYVFVIRILADD